MIYFILYYYTKTLRGRKEIPMINYGIIGAGNCGGQIVNLAANLMKVDGIAINTSDQDLSEVKSETVKSYLIGDKKGAGQNRLTAKKSLKAAIREITESEEFKKFVSSLELIYIVSSTGGGTGSGISPILYHMISQMTTAPVILVGILPTLGEDRGVQMNTANYLDEIYNKISNTRYMLYDNNKALNKSSVDMLKTINEAVVHDMKVISCFYNQSTPYSSIDDQDMMSIINPAGRIVVASVDSIKEKDLDEKGMEERLIDDLKKSYQCELDRDKICMNTGLITNLSPKLNDSLDMNIPAVHEFIGEPKGTGFKHIGITDDDSEPNYTYLIGTGLSPVNDRIKKIGDRIEELNEKQKELPAASALNSIQLDAAVDTDKEVKATVDVNDSFGLLM